jgi:hypothetical protein
MIALAATWGIAAGVSRKQCVNELKSAREQVWRHSLSENERAGLKCNREFGAAASRGLDDLARGACRIYGEERHAGAD